MEKLEKSEVLDFPANSKKSKAFLYGWNAEKQWMRKKNIVESVEIEVKNSKDDDDDVNEFMDFFMGFFGYLFWRFMKLVWRDEEGGRR